MGQDFDDPKLLVYLDQHDVKMDDDFFKSGDSWFTHRAMLPNGTSVSFTTFGKDKEILNVIINFPSYEMSHQHNSWVKSLGITQHGKRSKKRLKKSITYKSKSHVYLEPNYEENRSLKLHYGVGGNRFSTIWVVEDRKKNWVYEFTYHEVDRNEYNTPFPDLPKRTYAHAGFDPLLPKSYYTMFNNTFTSEDVNYLVRYYRWKLDGDQFISPEGSYFKLAKEDDAGNRVRAYEFHSTTAANIPNEWRSYIPDHTDLFKKYGQCGHDKADPQSLIFYRESDTCFKMTYSPNYVLKRVGDLSYKFNESHTPDQFKVKMGCSLGDCEVGFSVFNFGDGCYFMGDFLRGEFYDGFVMIDKNTPGRRVDREKELEAERLERQKEVQQIVDTWELSAKDWSEAVSHHSKAKSEFRAFSAAMPKSFDSNGNVKVSSPERKDAKKHYNEAYKQLSELSAALNSCNRHCEKYDLCKPLDGKVYIIGLKISTTQRMLNDYNKRIWLQSEVLVRKDIQSLQSEMSTLMGDITSLMHDIETIRKTCRQDLITKYNLRQE